MMNFDQHKTRGFDFHNPVRIRFGVGCLEEIREITKGYHVILLTTPGFSRRGVVERVKKLIGPALIEVVDTIGPNPELDNLERTARMLQHLSIDMIVALGGGSVIDTAKAMSVMLSRDLETFSLRSHLENDALELDGVGIPVVAVPTTAGTGSEVTPFATVWDSVSMRKYSLTGSQVFPHIALLDPELTLSLPREVTIVTGLDTISHAFESVWNRNANSLTILLATEALRIGLPTLKSLPDALDDIGLRSRMLWASTLAGLAISQTRTALAHSISYPLTMHYGMPHGLACSFTLPSILCFNAKADDGRLEELALTLGFTTVEALNISLQELFQGLGVSKMLREYIRTVEQLEDLVPDMFTRGRSDNNMHQADYDDLVDLGGIIQA
ncbi:MAG: phosphonoacetaldehyde reductase [Firmicutes bacterium]|nr:phosphonoacetaldehyde reductase [Bacillota bacterium]